jgi:HEAT repeat protein
MELNQLLRSNDMRDVKRAQSELQSLQVSYAIALVKRLSLENDYELRCRAIDLMQFISEVEAVNLSLLLLNDNDPDVRITSIHCLWNFNSTTAVPKIMYLLENDPDELVRCWSAFALGHLADTSVIPALSRAADTDTAMDHEGRAIQDIIQSAIMRIRSAGGTA